MTKEEKKAFVEHYGACVASVDKKDVERFLDDYEKHDHDNSLFDKYDSYSHLVDCITLWESAVEWAKKESVCSA